MTPDDGYAIHSPTDSNRSLRDSTGHHDAVTDRLGCAETYVDYYRDTAYRPVDLRPDREALCIPLDGSGVVTFERPISVSRLSVTRKPPGIGCRLYGGSETTWLVVGTVPVSYSEESPSVVEADELEFAAPTGSNVGTAHLTEPLGCEGMKANVRRLDPGQSIPYHTEGAQEELFVPLDGPGDLRVAGTTHRLQAGDIVRVAPSTPRAARNEGDEPRRWFMVGAPPTGGPYEWGPDADFVDWSNAR